MDQFRTFHPPSICTLHRSRNTCTWLTVQFRTFHPSLSERFTTTGANSAKAENLFSAIDSTVKNDGVNWDGLVSIRLDNTKSGMGIRNSIKSRILEKKTNVFVAGCSYHLAHLAADPDELA